MRRQRSRRSQEATAVHQPRGCVGAAGARPEPVHVAAAALPFPFPRRCSRRGVETLPLLVLLDRFTGAVRKRGHAAARMLVLGSGAAGVFGTETHVCGGGRSIYRVGCDVV